VSDQVSYPYKTTGKIIFLYILFFIFLFTKFHGVKFPPGHLLLSGEIFSWFYLGRFPDDTHQSLNDAPIHILPNSPFFNYTPLLHAVYSETNDVPEGLFLTREFLGQQRICLECKTLLGSADCSRRQHSLRQTCAFRHSSSSCIVLRRQLSFKTSSFRK
jgi:hypothetical protein